MSGRVRGVLERLLGRPPESGSAEGVTDAELVRRFVATRDEAAFELLVWRHGPMVLGLCRRAIRDQHLAEDAFQAVFLVLARKAASIRGNNVGGWLFRVGRRVVARAARTRFSHLPLPDLTARQEPPAAERRELSEALDAEVARLPERLRRVVVLCYLGGRTTEDAARELGCPRGTVLSRLATARKRLAERVARRGLMAPAAALTFGEATLGRLVSQTTQFVRSFLHAPVMTGPALLAESVVRAMATTRVVLVCSAVLLATSLTVGVGLVAAGTGWAETGSAPAAPVVRAGQSLAPAANFGEQAGAKSVEKTDLLRKQADRLAREIETLQARITREIPEGGNAIDASVLLAELLDVDKSILRAESQVKARARALAQAVNNQQGAAKEALPELEVAELIQQDTAVRKASARLANGRDTVASLKRQLGDEHPVLQAATKELLDAEAALKAARDAARPAVEKQLRERQIKGYADAVARAKAQVEVAEGQLEDLLHARKKLAVRIAEIRQGEARLQTLQDELKVLREIHLELLRRRALAELGIEGIQLWQSRSETDPLLEGQLRELRREIEALRAEVAKLRKKE